MEKEKTTRTLTPPFSLLPDLLKHEQTALGSRHTVIAIMRDGDSKLWAQIKPSHFKLLLVR